MPGMRGYCGREVSRTAYSIWPVWPMAKSQVHILVIFQRNHLLELTYSQTMHQVDPRLTPGSSRFDRAWFEILNQAYAKPLSNFASNFNVRPYSVESGHYIAYVQWQGAWFRCDDHQVSKTLNLKP